MTHGLVEKVRNGMRLATKYQGTNPMRFAGRLAAWRIRTVVGQGATVAFPRYRAVFWCPPEWRGMSKMAYILRDECELELNQLRRWVTAGDLVVDVGAHYGSYTIALSRIVGDAGQVVAIEPSAKALAALRRNTETNRLSNVLVVEAGLGEEPTAAVLNLHDDPSRASLNRFADGAGTGQEQIRLVRLDDTLPAERRVAFIKIDVEGYELPALRGAAETLERDRPTVLFELLPSAATRGGLPAYGAWDFLADLGYRFERVDPRTGQLRPVLSPDQAAGPNVIAVGR